LTCGLLALFSFSGVSGSSLVDAAAAEPAPPVTPTAPIRKGPKLELRLDDMTPRVITADGPSTLTITGELTNVGNDAATGLKVRPQRGDRLRTEGELRAALSGDDAADTQMVGFTELVETLAPGQRFPVRLTVPLRGAADSTLALQRIGVYPLLINVNSESGDGERTRVAAVRVLLPVLGLPGAAGTAAAPGAAAPAGDVAVVAAPPADPSSSNPVTLLYPLADRPHRLPTGPGEPIVLGSDGPGPNGQLTDELADELTSGGRLDGLLDALDAAAPLGSAVRDSLCLAIDPDLLRTVADMRGGYRLRSPDGAETEGKGAEAATTWLNRLRAAAAGRCVLAIPFADADLVALSRAGLSDLSDYATRDGARIVTELLGTQARPDLTWPADGLLDERSLTDFLGAGGHTLVLSSDGVEESGRSRGTIGGTVRLNAPRGRSRPPVALLADPLLTLAAGAPETGNDTDGTATNRGIGSLNTSTSVSPAGTGAPLSGEDLTAAVVFRALDPTAAGSSLLVAPPHRWNTSGEDARELLATVGRLVASGQFRGTPLPGGPDLASEAGAGSLVYPLRAGAREVPSKVTAKLNAAWVTASELRSAAVAQPGTGYTPAQVFDPVTEGLLRAASAMSRGQEDQAGAATKVITDRVRQLRSSVRVLEPPSPFALGDRQAPLPITLANGLPVAMRVRVALGQTPGLRTEPIPAQQVPPLGRLQLRVNAQLSRSGQFSVEARLTTLAGAQLGPVSRLQLRSTAYGTITLWLTGIAGALLVILAVRRITRRIRAARARPNGMPPPVPGEGPGQPLTDRSTATPRDRDVRDRDTSDQDGTTDSIPAVSPSGSRRIPTIDQTLGPLPPFGLTRNGPNPSKGSAPNVPAPNVPAPNVPAPPPRSAPNVPTGPAASVPTRPAPNGPNVPAGPVPNGRTRPLRATPRSSPSPGEPRQPPPDPGRRPSGTRGR
jgi:hypothetical protein